MRSMRFLSIALLAVMLFVFSCDKGSSSDLPASSSPSQPSFSSEPQTTSNKPMAVLADVQGSVEVYEQGGTWVAASAGLELIQDDKIRTGENSSALITFFEGSSIELESDTEIRIAELAVNTATGSTTIKMGQSVGSTVSRVKKLVDSESTYEIETPSATAMVRGSVGRVIVLNNGITIVLNEEGQWLAYAQGQTVAIPSGWQVTITPGSPPGPLTEPPAPSGKTPPNNQDNGDPELLIADFSASTTYGALPLTVQFACQCTGYITEWAWTFGDGGTSTMVNPEHVYVTPGIYTVTLTISGLGRSATETKQNYILVAGDLPLLDFSASPTEGGIPLSVDFETESEGAISDWSWDFGDGGTSHEQNPTYVYNVPGIYTVSLTVTYVSGTQTVTKNNYINVWNAWTQTTDDDFDSGILNSTMIVSDQELGSTGNDGMVVLDLNNETFEPDWTPSTPFDDIWLPIYGTTYRAQTFTPGLSGIPVQFILRLRKVGSPLALIVELRDCDITGAPGNTVLASYILPGTLFEGSFDDNYEVYFPPLTLLEEGFSYALVLHQVDDQGNALNYFEWECSVGYTYGGGSAWESFNSAASWAETQMEGTTDFYFESWIGQYNPYGTYESDSHDCGAGSTFGSFVWDATVPAGSELQFQIATNNDNSNWNFIGPDGTNDTYYETSGTLIWAGHNGDRYVKYKAYFDRTSTLLSPQLKSVSILYR